MKTSFNDANLADSVLLGVDGENASFKGANLRNAALISADMTGADFTNANLSRTRLASVNVKDADFTNADLTDAHAYHVDWDTAKVPPSVIPQPLLKLSPWVGAVIFGSLIGILALIIYALVHKKTSKS